MKLLTIIFFSTLFWGCSGQKPLAVVTNNSAAPSARTLLNSPDVSATPQPKTNSAVVISEHANLRQSANQQSDVIDVVSMDSSVEVVKQRGVWFYVKTDTGLQGWMHGNTLRLESFETAKPAKTPVFKQSAPTYQPDTSAESDDLAGGSTQYITGPRGGCYYINGNGNKTYVDRSMCGGTSPSSSRKLSSSSGNGYTRGPRGGCYYITGSGRKQYVDRSLCD